MIERNDQGFYLVDWAADFAIWLQWRSWHWLGLHIRFCPQKLTTFLAEPPTTSEGARMVAGRHRDIRKEIANDRTLRGFTWRRKIPDDPAPWLEWPRDLCNAITAAEHHRRDLHGSSFEHVPAYQFEPHAVVRQLRDPAASVPERTHD